MSKGKKSGQQKFAEQQSAYDVGQQQADVNQQNQLEGTAQGTLSQFEGPVQNSPFYKALLTTGIQDTSRAYDTATSNMRQRANAAGFGYNQPVEEGGENQVRAAETSALARVPQDAMIAAAPLSVEAADETARMGMGYGSEALGWGNEAQGWNQQASNLQQKRGGGFDWGSAANDALKIALMAAAA